MEVEDLFVDLADGIKLLKLLEVISGEKLGKPNNGRMRVHKIENVNKSLAFLHTKVNNDTNNFIIHLWFKNLNHMKLLLKRYDYYYKKKLFIKYKYLLINRAHNTYVYVQWKDMHKDNGQITVLSKFYFEFLLFACNH